jgi:transglycosylase-like protein with SLT domain
MLHCNKLKKGMRNKDVETAAIDAVEETVFPQEFPRQPAAPPRNRKRFLGGAAFGIAGAGWAFLAAPPNFGNKPVTVGTAADGGKVIEVASQAKAAKPLTTVDLSNFFGGAVAQRPQLPAWTGDGTVAALQFDDDVRALLPRYQPLFKEAGERCGIDWRLLAAMAYQESNWNPKARSPTGVRGMMMLTEDTADELDVNRENPAESISGGAMYLQQIRERLPPRIREPDRTWMALAAYNQGMGHLLDARELAVMLGRDPNRWQNVRAALPLLAQPRWFGKLRHGYAEGGDAVAYVANVSGYYDLLSTITTKPAVQVASRGV